MSLRNSQLIEKLKKVDNLEIIIDNKIPTKKIDIAIRKFSVTNFIFK